MLEPQESVSVRSERSRMVRNHPILAVPDVPAAVQYYRDVLAFADVWSWGEPPSYGGASRDEISFHFSLNPTLVATTNGQEFWIQVENVEGLHAQHQAAGAEITSVLEPKPWGVQEYTVQDLNGYILRFAQPLDRPSSK